MLRSVLCGASWLGIVIILRSIKLLLDPSVNKDMTTMNKVVWVVLHLNQLKWYGECAIQNFRVSC